MTTVAFASAKGAPGVTTLTCLVAALWPEPGERVVVECDPDGGDLAARFRLSSRSGWPSLLAAARRGEQVTPVDDHLQVLPGGLEVLVGTEGIPRCELERSMATLIATQSRSPDRRRHLLVDLGRIRPDEARTATWLECFDSLVVVARTDPASLVHVRGLLQGLPQRTGGSTGLALVGRGEHADAEVEGFVGLPVMARLPFDPAGAGVAAGAGGGRRRLRRGGLLGAARQLATAVAGEPRTEADHGALDATRPDTTGTDATGTEPSPVGAVAP